MGKGDVRTRKGKIYSGSYGNARPHGVSATAPQVAVSTKAAVTKKPAAKKKA